MYNKTDDFDFEEVNFPSLKAIYIQTSHTQHFSHNYLYMQEFIVVTLILKMDVKF